MKQGMNAIKLAVRKYIRGIAKGLDKLTGGKITPNGVTWFGFAMHVPIAYLIATGNLLWAGVFLIVFGLFDTLDGELARLQNRETNNGGFLDASTDRLKEVLLYAGAAQYFTSTGRPSYAAIAVIACGASLSVSYTKAKGEAIIASQGRKMPYAVLNRIFSDGFFPFEIRMAVLAFGLLFAVLPYAVLIVALGSTITVFQRIYKISRAIS